MDKFVKRYYHYEKDEKGNDVKVMNKISRKNPEHSEAFSCDQNVILAKLQLEAVEKKRKQSELEAEILEDKKRRKREREEFEARKARGEIDRIEFEAEEEKRTASGVDVTKKTQVDRPVNWMLIGQHFNEFKNMKGTLRAFEDDEQFMKKTEDAREQAVRIYAKQCTTGYVPKSNVRQYSVLGKDIEKELHENFLGRRSKGLAVTNLDIRVMVRALLGKYNLNDYLNKGFTFGDSWVRRWCRRWNVSDRAATTKMRESVDPQILIVKDEKYKEVLGRNIVKYLLPVVLANTALLLKLIFGCDETSLQFYPRAKRTLDEKGVKRVRCIGIGDLEKQQSTCTVLHNFDGEIADAQIIFQGKTNRVHPYYKQALPDELKGHLFSHSESHWQTEVTYIEFIDNLFIPFKNKILMESNLPPDTWVILVHDMHYSHLDKDVREHLKTNHIAHVYIGAGCTDLRQIADVIINKIFKGEIRNEFREEMHAGVERWMADGNDLKDWEPNLDFKHVRNRLPHWVNNALIKLRPQLKDSIRKSARKDALLDEVLKDEFLDLCKTLNANQPLPEHQEEEEEEEEDHGIQYEDEDDEGIFADEEISDLQNMVAPTLTVKKGENGTGGKITISKTALMLCCCGRNENYHKANIPSGVKMDHTCSSCKKPCYGLCTEDYKCYKCLYI